MRFTIEERGRRVDLEAHNIAPHTPLADLIRPFHPDLPGHATVDGAPVPLDRQTGSVPEGFELTWGGRSDQPPGPAVVELHAVAGPLAGRIWRLAPGTYPAGPSSTCSIHLADAPPFTIEVGPGGTATIRRVEATPAFWAGPHHLQFMPPAPALDCPPTTRRYFNRPPRPRHSRPEASFDAPNRTPVQSRGRRMSAITLIVPVLTGVFLAVVFHRVLFLAFALISPVMMIGNTWDDRRRRRRETDESEAQFQVDLGLLADSVRLHQETLISHLYATVPSIADLVSRADRGAVTLWERRPDHADFGVVVTGYGAVDAPIQLAGSTHLEPEVAELVDARRSLPCAPVQIGLASGSTIGLVGDRARCQAAARAITAQMVTLHGPADLRVAVVTDQPASWDWAKWLPHTCVNGGTEIRLLSGSDAEADHVLGFLRAAPSEGGGGPITLLVLDHLHLDDDRRTLATAVLAGTGRAVTGIVLAEDVAHLPSRCTTVMDLSEPQASMWEPGRANAVRRFLPVTIDIDVATRIARRLTHLDDPEAAHPGSGLPSTVSLLGLLGLDEPTAGAIADRWAARDGLDAPVGATEGGALHLDLVHDGPHALVAGTTGSGKSEFLRSLVTGLATTADPDHLNFVLIDYKGGAAFDVCADLPHVVGLVTDLDEHLGRRALICLEAELHHREARLRDAGAASIDELWAQQLDEPLPRLAVVVDEFATLAAELPDFMDALVDIAQRGRSLGVHVVLATQRPAGIVKDSIRANTNLRVSLRVQTPADSTDVLGAPDAARISRSHPGRGLVRLGPGELIPFQTALVSGRGAGSPAGLSLTPFVFGLQQPAPPAPPPRDDGPSDLDRLVAAITEAFATTGHPPPRRPWPDPLPTTLSATELHPREDRPLAAPMGLVDLPAMQHQDTWEWDPATDGNLLLAGIGGAGPGSAAVAGIAALARRVSPDDLHIYGIDHGAGALSQLRALPHVGAVIPAGSIDRQIRLIELLRRELHHRRATGRPGPTIMFTLDGLSGFRTAFDDPELVVYRERLNEIVAAGPSRGIFTIVTADQARSVPGSLAGSLPHRLVFSLADRLDYSTLGLTATPPHLPVGRAIEVRTGHLVQTVTDPSASIEAAAEWEPAEIPPDPIATLATEVTLAEVVDAGLIEPTRWDIPIGLDDRLLRPVAVPFYDGDHLLVAGPRRSGRSSALATIAAAVHKLDETVHIVAVAAARSPLADDPVVDQVIPPTDLGALAGVADSDPPRLLLVDDAETVDDPDGILARLLSAIGSPVHIVAAGRTDVLRSLPRHWTRPLRSSRRGIVLQPADPSDGDVVGIRLPRIAPITTPGRGYLIDGTPTLIQMARG